MSEKTGLSYRSIKRWTAPTDPKEPLRAHKKELEKLFIEWGIDKMLPTEEQVDELVKDLGVIEKTADQIIENLELGDENGEGRR